MVTIVACRGQNIYRKQRNMEKSPYSYSNRKTSVEVSDEVAW